MNIFYATDENYCAHTGVSIASLLENNLEEEEIIIYILIYQVLDESLQKLCLLEKKYKNVKFKILSGEQLLERTKQ